MLQATTDSEQRLFDVAEEWISYADIALAEPAIQEELGHQRAQKLRRLAQGAGIIVVGESVDGGKTANLSHTTSRNGLYFLPHDQTTPPKLTLNLPYQNTFAKFELDINPDHRAAYTQYLGYKNRGIISFCVSSQLTPAEKASLISHELTHVVQFKDSPDTKLSAKQKTQHDAQAYDVQLKILNHYWGDVLRPLIEPNAKHNESCLQYFGPGSYLRPAIDDPTSSVGNALLAVARNLHYGYDPAGSSPPPPQLVREYRYHGLIAA